MISLRNVSRVYAGEGQPVSALCDISFDIGKCEFVAITGPSGCGKSTLMHILGGLDQATHGEVIVDGLPLHSAGEKELTHYRRTKLGIVFQFFNLLPTMTVRENVALPLLLQGQGFAGTAAAVSEKLELVGLSRRADHLPHQLSGGEMQRTAIARALVHGPTLLLADEPTGNLDSTNATQVMETLEGIHQKQLATIILVTHSPDAARAAGRHIALRDGRIESDTAIPPLRD